MKKNMFLLTAVVFAALVAMGNLFADEPRKMTEQEVAAMEAELFVNMDKMGTPGTAKFNAGMIEASGDAEAKCWFRGWRWSYYYYYPSYYYYTWYCPYYYVDFRLVTYTVPVVPVVQTAAVATTTTEVATTTATVIAKSSGKLAQGAVVNQKVPAGSPLAKLGLRSGDIITSVDGNPVNALIDVRRIKQDSHITYVRGNQILVSGKPLLQRTTDSVAKSYAYDGVKQAEIDLDVIKANKDKKISLYEYYDQLEKSGK